MIWTNRPVASLPDQLAPTCSYTSKWSHPSRRSVWRNFRSRRACSDRLSLGTM
ncbi:MAG: hypothetical protein AVDCRST_MAG64-2685 [uncultured Phycisphaerae bacterium]|uniref:Uncharacterized protein n=1 Tax=uncultured Phycisphaerae bacterium TaxID=904963 RepID=A0A6J4PLP0_9BACT|nr:MAG: hypothetical protein AVDCRST_MAG64-2685 [uncultured Phycisphaerae bacterium]